MPGQRSSALAATALARLTVVVLAVLSSGCGFFGDQVRDDEPTAPSVLTVVSPAFDDGDPVPRRFTCDGADISPPLSWSGVPFSARALAVVVTDPDAPGGTYVHWVLLNLDPALRTLGAGEVPPDAVQARNSAGHARYDGPCPPGGTHRYRLSVYALRTPTSLPDGVDTSRALGAVAAKAIGRGTLVGTVAAG